jgi:quercetin 2,3-dioxygenase
MAKVLKIVPRLSQARGHANHGWLKTFHTFSFAEYVLPSMRTVCIILTSVNSYHEAEHSQFGCLRVINEDRVAPKTGFGTHAHREFEIFSYIVDGELEQ